MNTLKAALSTTLITLAAAHSASAAELNLPGWYAGVDVGQSDYRQKGGGLDDVFANQGFTTSTSMDRHDTAWGLDLGYRFNRWFALEGGYVDLGRFDYNTTAIAPAPGTISGRVDSEGVRLTAVGIVPLDNGFSLFGKAGVFDLRTRLEGHSPSGDDLGVSHRNGGGTFGAGASYDITPAIGARIEWDRYLHANDSGETGKADIDLVTAGLVYHF